MLKFASGLLAVFSLLGGVIGSNVLTTRRHTDDKACRDYTNDLCSFEMGDMITSSLGDDQDFCQFLCSTIYQTRCTYFLYDYVQKMCKIYGGDKNEPSKYCRRFAGPPSPSQGDCQHSDRECHGFIESNCDYKGDVIQGYPNVQTLANCQLLCQHTQGCDYFLYDTTNHNCDVLNSRLRSCDILIGPPSPALENCLPQ